MLLPGVGACIPEMVFYSTGPDVVFESACPGAATGTDGGC